MMNCSLCFEACSQVSDRLDLSMNCNRPTRHQALVLLLALAIPAVSFAEPTYAPSDGGDASGDPGATAVLPITLKGSEAPVLRNKMQQNALASLRARGIESIGVAKVKKALKGKPGLTKCTGDKCYRKIATLVRAKQLIRATLEVRAGTNFEIKADLIVPGRAEPVVNRVQRSCTPCSLGDLDKAMRETFDELTKPPPTPKIAITCNPEGARLKLDGKPLGQAPYSGELSPGEYTLTVSADGYETAVETVVVRDSRDVEGSVQTFPITLIPEGVGTPKRSRPVRFLKFATAAAALGAIGTGTTWVIIHERETCTDEDPCPEVYNTRWQGIATIGAGIGLAVGTYFLFKKDAADAKRAQVALVPTSGGAVAHLGFRF